MSGMADVVAGVLMKHGRYVRNEDFGGVICDECGWEVASKWPEANEGTSTMERAKMHEAHAVLATLSSDTQPLTMEAAA